MEETIEKSEKYILNGHVAVIYSPGYGAGFGSWNERHMPEIVTDAKIVEFILLNCPGKEFISAYGTKEEEENMVRLQTYITSKYAGAYTGADVLKIKWIPLGERWRIEEYDGAEHVEILDINEYYLA